MSNTILKTQRDRTIEAYYRISYKEVVIRFQPLKYYCREAIFHSRLSPTIEIRIK